MMKSFFKKLAFVMALAMVVSMAAPAAVTASAAEFVVADRATWATKTEANVEVGGKLAFRFKGAPTGWDKLGFAWSSSDEEVATVDSMGYVTGVNDGVATITIQDAAKEYVASVVVTVGEGEVEEVVENSFTATQKSDKKVALTFVGEEVTKAALEAALGFYYFVGDYKVEVDLIKSISDVKDGVAEVELYTTVKDGVTYGFTYGDYEPAEFKAVIGDVTNIYFTYEQDKAYVDSYTKLTPVLLNDKGHDITATAMGVNGAYVLFTEAKQAENGEYWVVNDTIYFSEVTAAEVKVQYFGGYDENGDAIVGPYIELPVVSKAKPVYGVDFDANPTVDVATGENFDDGLNKKIAVGDNGFSLFVKTKDNEGNPITSTDNTRGTWRFESTNVSKLYVTSNGQLMPNAAGDATVLVYYKANEDKAVEGLVAAVKLTVSPARATTSVVLDKTTATVSTVDGYNTADFTVTLTDGLGQARPDGQKVTIKTTTNVTTATAKPDVAGETDGEVDVYTTGGEGKVTFRVTASAANIAANSTSGVQTYNFTVTSNNITRNFSVTIKAPQMDGGNFVASGYKLTTGGATDVKVTDDAELEITADFALLSSGVPVAPQTFTGKKPANAADATKDAFYFAVTKNGSDITSNAKVTWVGEKITIALTNANGSATTADTAAASGTALSFVQKDLGAGTYRIVVYQAIAAAGATTPSSFKTVTSATVVVGDTQGTASYGGKLAATATTTDDYASVVKNCFKFVVDGKTYDEAADYTDAQIIVKYNPVLGNVLFVNSVDFYKLTDCGAYIKYSINIGDYVTLQ